MPSIDRDGLEIHYEVEGSGPTVLLTHGFGASSHMFAGTAVALARRHQVVRWDIRGHGATSAPDDPSVYSAQESLADMAGVLDAVGAARAVLAGHSLGGFLSLAFRLALPERVRALVLVDTGPGYRRDEARAGWNRMAERFAADFERRGFAALATSEETAAVHHRSAQALAHAARGILTQRDARVIDSLADIDVPTLVVVGERDEAFLGGSRYMAEKIPGARLAVIEGAGHAPNLSHPERFDAVLASFLDELEGHS